ncbi:MAG: IPExxxVDY family protein, partial [Bacteroidia bacterium]|nr:IPExxxVDY family protein [Bacteroidia bacterium]
MKKLLLSEDTDYQVSLAGIISPLPFYRLAYLINSELEFNFSLDDDWIAEVQDKKTSAIKSEHVYYSYYDEMLEMAWSIIKNRGT